MILDVPRIWYNTWCIAQNGLLASRFAGRRKGLSSRFCGMIKSRQITGKRVAAYMDIKHLIFDVDGTLTDSGLYYDSHGNEMKKFSTKDGAGFYVARAAGISLIVLTGRECDATLRRMTELGVDVIKQNVKDKALWLKAFMKDNGIKKEEIGYVGDDINDLSAMQLCGFVGCPSDAGKEVKALATYVSTVKGGSGAGRDCIEHLLTEAGEWDHWVKIAYL
jgi:3-deoxy-D-manno-octulosonate 8-phosphate phosphatase (KDO 8-P phosphatase)